MCEPARPWGCAGLTTPLYARWPCEVATSTAMPQYNKSVVMRRLQSMPWNDLHQIVALTRAASSGRQRDRPRAIVFSTAHGAMLAGRRGEPFGIRFDTPARLSRLGPEFAWERILERRSFKSARILLPWGDEVGSEMAAVLPAGVAAVPLPVPIETDDLRREGGAVAVTYAGNPWKKGLDLIVRAWSIVRPETELVIAGISRENGLAYLRRCNLAEPTGVTWAGITSHESSARSPGVRRYTWLPPGIENYGIAQLEALADGALLVTVPSDGPYAALRLARRLAPRLAPQEISAEALAEAMRAALEMTDAERGAYREAAARELAPHSFEELVRRIRDKVLPTLLG